MGYPNQKLDPVDMPDQLNWMDETHGITMESRQHTAADVLIDWLADPRPAIPPGEEVKALAQLYEKTSVTYTRNSAAPPPPFAAAGGMREAEKLLGPGSTLLGKRPSWWQRLMGR